MNIEPHRENLPQGQDETPTQENKKNIPAEFISIGNHLKSLRTKRKLSLRDISVKTKINLSILKSLEENQLQELPKKIYVTGFVKSYAKIIHADASQCIHFLDQTYDVLFPKHEQIQSKQRHTIPENEELTSIKTELKNVFSIIPKKVWQGLAATSVIALLLAMFVNKFQSSKEEVAELARQANSKIPPHAGPNATHGGYEQWRAVKEIETAVKEQVPAKKPEVIEPEPVIISDEKSEPKKAPASIAQTGNYRFKESVSFSNLAVPMYSVIEDAPEASNEEIIPENIRFAIKPGLQNVYINAAMGDTWISYKNGSSEVKSFILRKGRTLLVRGEVLRIFLGNVGATHVFLNNQLLKIHTSNGVKSMVFPETKAKEFKVPFFVRDVAGNTFTSEEYIELEENGRISFLNKEE